MDIVRQAHRLVNTGWSTQAGQHCCPCCPAGEYQDGEPQGQVEVPLPEMSNLEELAKVITRHCQQGARGILDT
jgi:hypothetical protein